MKRKRLKKKKIIFCGSIIISAALLANFGASAFPGFNKAATRAAVLSAGLMLPEGGETLLSMNSEEHTLETDPSKVSLKEEKKEVAQTETETKTKTGQTQAPGDDDKPPTANVPQEEIDAFTNNSGPVIRKQYKPGSSNDYINIKEGAYVRNMTKLPNEDVQQAINDKPAFNLTNTTEPQVLIIHTHTTEGFSPSARDFYDAAFPTRTFEHSRSVVSVGDELTKQLEKVGINVVHDTTVHDNPQYSGSYDRSKVTAQAILDKHPSIKVVLDIHRDSIADKSGNRYAPVANINGRDAAQIMLISGCNDGTMDYPNYKQNLAFATDLQAQIETDNPGITRALSFKYKYYNQSLTPGTLLMEVGSDANSIDEAIYSGWLVGKSLAKTLKSLQS